MVIFHLFREKPLLNRIQPKFVWCVLCSRHYHVYQVSYINSHVLRFYRGLNFPFSYWFLHRPYNSAAQRRCLWSTAVSHSQMRLGTPPAFGCSHDQFNIGFPMVFSVVLSFKVVNPVFDCLLTFAAFQPGQLNVINSAERMEQGAATLQNSVPLSQCLSCRDRVMRQQMSTATHTLDNESVSEIWPTCSSVCSVVHAVIHAHACCIVFTSNLWVVAL